MVSRDLALCHLVGKTLPAVSLSIVDGDPIAWPDGIYHSNAVLTIMLLICPYCGETEFQGEKKNKTEKRIINTSEFFVTRTTNKEKR